MLWAEICQIVQSDAKIALSTPFLSGGWGTESFLGNPLGALPPKSPLVNDPGLYILEYIHLILNDIEYKMGACYEHKNSHKK